MHILYSLAQGVFHVWLKVLMVKALPWTSPLSVEDGACPSRPSWLPPRRRAHAVLVFRFAAPGAGEGLPRTAAERRAAPGSSRAAPRRELL